MQGALLQGFHLKETVMKNAILQGADLQGADLAGADLQGADLGRANLRGVINLKVKQVCAVKTLYLTKLDPELEEKARTQCQGKFEKPKT